MQHIAFMESEDNRKFTQGFVQVSASPWRAQASVVRSGPKPRMVIDCPHTIIRHTSKDALSIPNMPNLLAEAIENFFSKIDLKPAYHQIPLHLKDQPFSAFEVNGRVMEFSRNFFGVTNAVVAFRRERNHILMM